ncbi:MAG TPA: T9SS type A sorting domain-containing protein [Bacteroidetes bacterium]|nr:T9SS type A sorting domain-containing protein [Bacteroidota bacterium]
MSPTFEVAPSNFHNLRPQIALVNGETPLVIWGSTIGGRKGWVARWNGSGFDAPKRANPNGSINAYSVEGPNIAAKGDTAYLVYATAPASAAKAILRTSLDGGLTWGTPRWIDSLNSDLPSFPNVSIDNAGNPLIIYMRQKSNFDTPKYMVRTSTDAGQTWATEADASLPAPGGEVCDCCTGKVYASPGRIVALFRNNDNNLRDIWATWSTDGGQNFGAGIDLDSTDWVLAACPSSGPAAHIQNDSIFSFFMSAASGKQRIYMGAAHLDSLDSGFNRMLNPGIAVNTGQNYPAVAGKGDTIGVVWAHYDSSSSSIYMKYSFTGVAGLFNQPAFSIVDSVMGAHDYPDIAFENGVFHIVWSNQSLSSVMYRRLAIDSFVVGLPVSAPENTLQIAPNPVKETAHISWKIAGNESGNLRIMNVAGKLLMEKKVTGNGELAWQTEKLAKGMYFVTLKLEFGKAKTLRFVVD